VLTLELQSPSLPKGKKLVMNVGEKMEFVIKEGVEYKCVSHHLKV
jgi:hypothetical protein